jgi:biopolymer transport protein ExbD
MKLKTSSKVHYDAGPNMTPLVDVVMVILIFLMLTGSFAVGEHFLSSNLPLTKKGGGGAAAANVPLDEPLEIRVDNSSTEDQWVAVAGRIRVQGSRLDLTKQLTKMREALNANQTPTEKIQVVISPGKTTKYKHLIEVYEAALDAKFTKVAFAPAH